MDITCQLDKFLASLDQRADSAKLDSVQMFIDEHLPVTPGHKVKLGEVYRTYVKFCKEKGLQAHLLSMFPNELREHNIVYRLGWGNCYWLHARSIQGIEIVYRLQ